MAKAAISKKLRDAVLIRDNHICRACGFGGSANHAPFLDCDHAISEADGGPTVKENLQCLCKACNVLKSSNSHTFKIRNASVEEEVWANNQKVIKMVFTLGKHYLKKVK